MHSDVKIVDPIWTTAYITRNHGYMVYDTLFAMDEKARSSRRWSTSTTSARTSSPTRSRCATACSGTTAQPSRRGLRRLDQALGAQDFARPEADDFVDAITSATPRPSRSS
jgi:hypothetical protein